MACGLVVDGGVSGAKYSGGVGAFPEQSFDVEVPPAERQVALGLPGPLLLGTVPGQLEAVLVGLPTVKSLVSPVVVHSVQRPVRGDKPAQRVTEGGSRRIADGDVVEPRRSGRWRRAAFRLPGVEPEVMVVSAGGQEQGGRHAEHDVEPEDLDVEVMDAVDVSRLQMNVSDVDARRDRSRAALARRDAR